MGEVVLTLVVPPSGVVEELRVGGLDEDPMILIEIVEPWTSWLTPTGPLGATLSERAGGSAEGPSCSTPAARSRCCEAGWLEVQTWEVAGRQLSPRRNRRCQMNPEDFPAPKDGFVLTHFLVVSDQDRSRDFYRSLFDGQVLSEQDPVIMKVANSWLILNEGGGPTDDKPTVTLTTPPDPNRTSAFLNVRVADIDQIYKDWSAKGAEFLTEPKDHGREIRAYIRDPDGHLIEVGQATGILS